jgi:hypothetical protein
MSIVPHYFRKIRSQKCKIFDHVNFFSDLTSMLTHNVRKLKWSDFDNANISYLLPRDFKLNIFSCFVLNQLFEGGGNRYNRILDNITVQDSPDKKSNLTGMNVHQLQAEMNVMLCGQEDVNAVTIISIDRSWDITPQNMVHGTYYVTKQQREKFLSIYREYCALLHQANKGYIAATKGKIAKLATAGNGYVFHSESEPFDIELKAQYMRSIGQMPPEFEERMERLRRISTKLKGEHISYTSNYMLDLLGIEL